MTNEFTAWKNWTDEQWLNAVFCDDCGLPLLETEPNEDGISELICAFCNWTDDETNVIHTTVAALRAELAALKEQNAGCSRALTKLMTEHRKLVEAVEEMIEMDGCIADYANILSKLLPETPEVG